MNQYKYAYTLIEVVFVIVILGILAAVAIPKFAVTRKDAQIAKGRSDIAAIRSAIMTERQNRLFKGENQYISGVNLNSGTGVFGGVLTYSESDSNTDGHWHLISENNDTATYNFKVGGVDVLFTYIRENGTLTCDADPSGSTAQKYCYRLTQ